MIVNFLKNGTRFFLLFISVCSIFNLFSPAVAGTVIVGNVISNSVSLFDEKTLLAINEIKVGFMPHEVVVTPNGQYALVSNFGDLFNVFPGNTLSVIDVANAKNINTIQLPDKSRPHGLAFINDTKCLITAQGIQSLLLVDIVKGTIDQTLNLPGAGAHMVIADKAKRFAYVANSGTGSIAKIDLQNFTVMSELKIGQEVEGLALSIDENILLATDRTDNYVAVVNPNTMTIINTIKTGYGPVRVEMFNQGKFAVVTNTISGNAQVIDMATLAIINTFKTTLSHSPLPVPINIAVRDDQTTAYITNSFANDITLVDLISGQILKTFSADYMPDGVAISPVDAINTDNSIEDAVFKAEPIDINAKIEDVWQITKNVEEYNRISHGAITAHVDGDISPGKTISLAIYKDSKIGKIIPISYETVTVVDDDRKIIAWRRKLPDGNFTERYQVLQKLSDSQTRSSIVLRIPGLIGQMTKLTLGETINQALTDLNTGMKVEAEDHEVKSN